MIAKTDAVDVYLAELPTDRREVVTQLCYTIRENLPNGFVEILASNMPAYVVPLDIYPDGYHVAKDTPLPFVSFASLKSHIALYHFGMYVDHELFSWFENRYAELADHKLDMGKSCVRFRNPQQIPMDLIAELMRQRTVKDWVERYVAVRSN